MTALIEVKTADLAGEALGWAVGKAEGLDVFLAPPEYGNPWRVFARYQGEAIVHTKRFNPWEDWALGGPLMDKRQALVGTYQIPGLADKASARLHHEDQVLWHSGETALIAICRAIVATKFGDVVQVPKELCA
ncbi:DUF2591 domain-containing protein [Pseudomonas putida]|uniref:DUF2591 domain-containing protein n=1 Tax=Pseudomonas putida TaxID=303 RepID=UPI00300E7426